MRHYYAVHHPRNFANEFDVVAFVSRAARDEYVASDPGPDGASTEACTRSEARARLSSTWLSPMDGDYRGAVNCYLGSGNEHTDISRRQECERTLDVDTGFCALPTGAATVPVRL